jgi:hypothetical protein
LGWIGLCRFIPKSDKASVGKALGYDKNDEGAAIQENGLEALTKINPRRLENNSAISCDFIKYSRSSHFPHTVSGPFFRSAAVNFREYVLKASFTDGEIPDAAGWYNVKYFLRCSGGVPSCH